MNDQVPVHFDFTEWSRLAARDPEAFERRRAHLLDQAIRQAPESRRHRLRCLQWRVDQIRRTKRTPMAACLEISRMMWDSVLGEDGLLDAIKRLQEPGASSVAPGARRPARILAFPRQPSERAN